MNSREKERDERMVQHYKEAFGLSPQEDRRRINLFRVQDNSPVPSI